MRFWVEKGAEKGGKRWYFLLKVGAFLSFFCIFWSNTCAFARKQRLAGSVQRLGKDKNAEDLRAEFVVRTM